MTPKTKAFITGGGARIYRIPIHLFPELWGYSHLVVSDSIAALVDVGSGFGESNDHLELGLQAVRRQHGESVEWDDITHVLITHAHIDHFGGLPYVRERSQAPIGIHELDRRVLTGYEERVATVAGKLRHYLREAGVEQGELDDLMDLYLLGKQLFASQSVDFTFEKMGMRLGPMEIMHVPGHTPGQVVILIDDVLLSADHILERISPHLAPESLTLNTGLGHYLDSLDMTQALIERTKLVLGGHERPFVDLSDRIEGTRALYVDRLGQVLDFARVPRTIEAFAQELFGETAGYHRLLALEEAGAYVEYLSMRGYLAVSNLASLEKRDGPPILYERVDDAQFKLDAAERGAQLGEVNVRI